MKFTFELDNKGYLKKRESFDLEYKQNFQLGDNLLKYLKTLAGMANNRGGQIVFGIKDSPHELLGMTNDKFSETDPKIIDSKAREYFAPSLRWHTDVQYYNEKKFGFLIVEEAEEKPVVCKKGNKEANLREGAIYYRYRGETKEIEYAELQKILEEERKKERTLWIEHIQKIAMVGPQNINLLDRYNGEITYGKGKVLIDKSLIKELNFIREGHFTEKDGEGLPTLKLVGTIDGIADLDNAIIDPNIVYPYTTKQLQEKLGVNQFEMQAIIFSLDLKNKRKRHTFIKQGEKSNGIHKYAESVVPAIENLMQKYSREQFIDTCSSKYKAYMKEQLAQHPRVKRKRR